MPPAMAGVSVELPASVNAELDASTAAALSRPATSLQADDDSKRPAPAVLAPAAGCWRFTGDGDITIAKK